MVHLESSGDWGERGAAAAVAEPARPAAVAARRREDPPEPLTTRQYEVLALLAAGYPMKAVARRLGITYRTVTFHKYRTMHRLGITTNAGLIAYALTRNTPRSGRRLVHTSDEVSQE
jgi:DNA-binding NarL/FixJ family response regulator